MSQSILHAWRVAQGSSLFHIPGFIFLRSYVSGILCILFGFVNIWSYNNWSRNNAKVLSLTRCWFLVILNTFFGLRVSGSTLLCFWPGSYCCSLLTFFSLKKTIHIFRQKLVFIQLLGWNLKTEVIFGWTFLEEKVEKFNFFKEKKDMNVETMVYKPPTNVLLQPKKLSAKPNKMTQELLS